MFEVLADAVEHCTVSSNEINFLIYSIATLKKNLFVSTCGGA